MFFPTKAGRSSQHISDESSFFLSESSRFSLNFQNFSHADTFWRRVSTCTFNNKSYLRFHYSHEDGKLHMMKSFFSSFLYGVRDYDNFAKSFCIYLTLFICVSSHVSSSSSRMSIWFVEGCFFFCEISRGCSQTWMERGKRTERRKENIVAAWDGGSRHGDSHRFFSRIFSFFLEKFSFKWKHQHINRINLTFSSVIVLAVSPPPLSHSNDEYFVMLNDCLLFLIGNYSEISQRQTEREAAGDMTQMKNIF